MLVVNVDDARVHNLSDFQNIGGLRNPLKRDLRNVDQTVHTVNDLGKCAERHQADDLHACNVTDRILRAEDVPRIALLGLVAERDALLFGVKALDVNRQRLADRDNILRLADVLPGQLGQVNHAVHAATEVNKRTVRGCALDNARVNLADFDVRPELRFLFAALFALNQTDRADCLLARFDFNDAEFNRLANQRGDRRPSARRSATRE